MHALAALSHQPVGRLDTSVALSTPVYQAFWWIAFVVHLLTGCLLLSVSLVHAMLSLPKTRRNTAALLIPVDLLRVSAVVYGVFATAHFVAVVKMLRRTIKYRSITRQLTVFGNLIHRASKKSSTKADAIENQSLGRRLCRRANRIFSIMMDLYGYISIGGPLFQSWLLMREVTEILMQSYQLWAMSYSVSRRWINHFAVGTVVLNCWSLPVVAFIFRKHEATRRLMHLVVDLYLDFTCSVVVPLLITVPYVIDFDWSRQVFPMYLIQDDVWLATALAEAKQVLIMSNIDLVTSCLPQYSILACLRLLKRSFHCQSPLVSSAASVVPSSSAPSSESIAVAHRRHARGTLMVNAATALWGFFILGLHIDAFSAKEPVDGCRLVVRQWLPTNKSCSLLSIDCGSHQIQGTNAEITEILGQLERSVLTRIHFHHCSALAIPPTIREFPSLAIFDVTSSSLHEWPAYSAVTQVTNPVLGTIKFISSNLSTIPPGVYHSQLPPFLRSIFFMGSTIGHIPDDIGDVWSRTPMDRLAFEDTNINSVPVSLGRVDVAGLWLTSNQITQFPEDTFVHAQFKSLRFSGNPLQRLPANIGDTSELKELLVEYTNVTELPNWTVAWLNKPRLTITKSFYGSPICDGANSTVQAWGICERDHYSHLGYETGELLNQPPPPPE